MAITRHSVDDYDEMIRLGALTERDRVELIRGQIVPEMAIGPRPPRPGMTRHHKARGEDPGAANISTSPRKPSSSASSSGCAVLEPILCSKYGGNALRRSHQ
jgi:hypothetical protein